VFPAAFHFLQSLLVSCVALHDDLFEVSVVSPDDLVCGLALARDVARPAQLCTCHRLHRSRFLSWILVWLPVFARGESAVVLVAPAALNLLRVASDLCAVAVEDVGLADEVIAVGERMPDVGVLGDESQGPSLTRPGDQKRDRSQWRWVEPFQPPADSQDPFLEVANAVRDRAERLAGAVLYVESEARCGSGSVGVIKSSPQVVRTGPSPARVKWSVFLHPQAGKRALVTGGRARSPRRPLPGIVPVLGGARLRLALRSSDRRRLNL
jgi:hypothetical protein